MSLKLYTYFRSSAAWRVRIALNLKGLPYEAVPVHLVRNGGEQLQHAYRAINPSALVPSLQDEGAMGGIITQSMAIIEYLEETHPTPPLLCTPNRCGCSAVSRYRRCHLPRSRISTSTRESQISCAR